MDGMVDIDNNREGIPCWFPNNVFTCVAPAVVAADVDLPNHFSF